MSTKSCRSCCVKINVTAKKCPHCQAFQSRWIPWLFTLSAALPLLIILPVIIPLWAYSTDSDPPEVQFKDVKHRLTVTEARLKYDKPSEKDNVIVVHRDERQAWVYCVLKNGTDHRWEDFEFLVEFKNANGDRLDLDNVSESVTSQPHSDLRLRLSCRLAVDPDEVSETKVTVTNARLPYR